MNRTWQFLRDNFLMSDECLPLRDTLRQWIAKSSCIYGSLFLTGYLSWYLRLASLRDLNLKRLRSATKCDG